MNTGTVTGPLERDVGRLREYAWATTSPNLRHRGTGFDAGQRGWRLHLVKVGQQTAKRMDWRCRPVKEVELDVSPALCGIRPAHGWGLDLFIDETCARCEARAEKLGIATPPI